MATRSEKVRLDQKTVGFSALYEVTKILGDPIESAAGALRHPQNPQLLYGDDKRRHLSV